MKGNNMPRKRRPGRPKGSKNKSPTQTAKTNSTRERYCSYEDSVLQLAQAFELTVTPRTTFEQLEKRVFECARKRSSQKLFKDKPEVLKTWRNIRVQELRA